MTTTAEDRAALEILNLRVRTLLPELYQDRYEDVQPASMGSADLKFGADGQVAWDEMWSSFCDLAMAGGPPHKGSLLEPGTEEQIRAEPEKYETVVDEICRGIELVTDLATERSSNPGWVRVSCVNIATAEWLLRAIAMENVAVRREGAELELPAGPSYRLEKETKNVITVMAKTCHYWFGHVLREQRQQIRELLAAMEQESPLLQPAFSNDGVPASSADSLKRGLTKTFHANGLQVSAHTYSGWLGLECADVSKAVWLMRALVASNCLSRREDTVCFVPVDPLRDPSGELAVGFVSRLTRLAKIRSAL
jgi:sirohydrochlorin cobaltochelatase